MDDPAELVLVEAVLNAEKKYAQATIGLNRALLSGAEKVALNRNRSLPRHPKGDKLPT
jgi:hypothetical protein